MIKFCAEAGLPEPQFRSEGERFVTTIWRDWLTEDVLAGLGLNERQMKAVKLVKQEGAVTNAAYQDFVKVTRKTAARDLSDLVNKGVFVLVGSKRGAHYILAENK